MFSRGFLTVFKRDLTGFATANKENCYAGDDAAGIGSVEWSREENRSKKNPWSLIVIIVLSVIIVVCIGVMCAMKWDFGVVMMYRKKENELKKSVGYHAMDEASSNICRVCLNRTRDKLL